MKNNVSVCLATFNGEKFIKEQLDSILTQLSEYDEVIIGDDCSTDNTISIIKSFADKRIKLIHNEVQLGVNKNFENLINLSSNEMVFFSDQDDVWADSKIIKTKEIFSSNSNLLLVSSNFDFLDSRKANVILPPLTSKDSYAYMKNIFNIFAGRSNYFGCAMAVRRKIFDYILPFPNLESHDLFIALAANLLKNNYHIEDSLVKRRIHEDNLSNLSRSVGPKLKSRLFFINHLLLLLFRIYIKPKKRKW